MFSFFILASTKHYSVILLQIVILRFSVCMRVFSCLSFYLLIYFRLILSIFINFFIFISIHFLATYLLSSFFFLMFSNLFLCISFSSVTYQYFFEIYWLSVTFRSWPFSLHINQWIFQTIVELFLFTFAMIKIRRRVHKILLCLSASDNLENLYEKGFWAE